MNEPKYSIVNGWICDESSGELENLFTIEQAERALNEQLTGAHRGQNRVPIGEFNPNWCMSPSVALSEIVQNRGWVIGDVAEMTATQDIDVTAYLSGMKPYPADWAVDFAKMVNCSPQFIWNLQNNYLLDLALGKKDVTKEYE